MLSKSELLDRYGILMAEMNKRGLKVGSGTPLDVALFRKSMYGIDIPGLGDLVQVADYINLDGSWADDPKGADDIDVIIREDEENRDEDLELKLGRVLSKATNKKIEFLYRPKGPHATYLPAFDKVLRAKDETKRVKVKERYDRVKKSELPVRYIYNREEDRIVVIKADKKKTEKPLSALEDYEDLLHHIHIGDDGKEEIHHCLILDHIANMFEQTHLWIKDGKVYLNGEEIKEGVFHVVKGLEPKQEVVWSDKEAEENKIKPKKMKIGMTLKDKAKEW